MTFISQAAPNSSAPTRDDVVAAMEEIAKAPVQPGSVERSREAILVDVPAAQAKQIAEVTQAHTLRTHRSYDQHALTEWNDEQQSSMGETVAACITRLARLL